MIAKLRERWAKRQEHRRDWLLPATTRAETLERAEKCSRGDLPHEYQGYVDQYGTHWECIWCRFAPQPGELQRGELDWSKAREKSTGVWFLASLPTTEPFRGVSDKLLKQMVDVLDVAFSEGQGSGEDMAGYVLREVHSRGWDLPWWTELVTKVPVRD